MGFLNRGLSGDRPDSLRHELPHQREAVSVKLRLVEILSRNQADERVVVDDRQRRVPVADHRPIRVVHRRVRRHGENGARHIVGDGHLRGNLFVEDAFHRCEKGFRIGIVQRDGRRLRVPSPSERGEEMRRIDAVFAASGDEVRPLPHPHRGEHDVGGEIVPESVDEQRQPVDIGVHFRVGKDDANPAPKTFPRILDKRVEELSFGRGKGHLDIRRNRRHIGAESFQSRHGFKIPRARSAERHPARVLVDARGEKRRILGGYRNALSKQYFHHERRGRADRFDTGELGVDVVARWRMMVIHMDADALAGRDVREGTDPGQRTRIHDHEKIDILHANAAGSQDFPTSGVSGEKIPDGLARCAGHAEDGVRIQLGRGDHTGKRIEVASHMARYDLHARRSSIMRFLEAYEHRRNEFAHRHRVSSPCAISSIRRRLRSSVTNETPARPSEKRLRESAVAILSVCRTVSNEPARSSLPKTLSPLTIPARERSVSVRSRIIVSRRSSEPSFSITRSARSIFSFRGKRNDSLR